MKNQLRSAVLFYCCAFACAPASAAVQTADAQAVRHETGRRLRLFERAWSQTNDPAARRRAIAPLKQSVNQFLGGRQLEAARSLDAARFALRSPDELPPAVRWAESLYAALDRVLSDAATKELSVTLDEFYKTDLSPPAGAQLVATVRNADDQELTRLEVAIAQLPTNCAISTTGLGEGDFELRLAIAAGGQSVAEGSYRFSLADRLPQRLEALEHATAGLDRSKDNVDGLSASAIAKLLGLLAKGEVLETDYPAARLLAEAEGAARAGGKGERFYEGKRGGQFWLRVAAGRTEIPVRIFVPTVARLGQPVPLVVALHGAGGSENLFFDGYGAGAIVDECEKRGWLLVSPRSAGFGLLPVEDLVTALEKIYPVQRDRVFMVGHSMGAMQASAAAIANPAFYAAVAALGGGGAAKANVGLEGLPYFVAAGSEDFALSGARRLEKNLREAGVERLLFREYPDVEHLLIVQEALPDVFRFFDETAAKNR